MHTQPLALTHRHSDVSKHVHTTPSSCSGAQAHKEHILLHIQGLSQSLTHIKLQSVAKQSHRCIKLNCDVSPKWCVTLHIQCNNQILRDNLTKDPHIHGCSYPHIHGCSHPSKSFRCRSHCDPSVQIPHSQALADRHKRSYTYMATVINTHILCAHTQPQPRHIRSDTFTHTCARTHTCTPPVLSVNMIQVTEAATSGHTQAETLLCTSLQLVTQDADLTRSLRDGAELVQRPHEKGNPQGRVSGAPFSKPARLVWRGAGIISVVPECRPLTLSGTADLDGGKFRAVQR